MNWLASKGQDAGAKGGMLTVLDLGSSKVTCFIARLKPREESHFLRGRTHQAQIVGIGHQKSRGVKSGVIIDLDEAEQAIRVAVDAAERMAGFTAASIAVNLSSGRLKSEIMHASIPLGGSVVAASDVRRVLSAGALKARDAERQVLHSLPVGYALDQERTIADPAGMMGETLGVDMHVVTSDAAPRRNLELCINRAHLSVEHLVASPYAAGLAALVDDEAELGAACIDFGGGTTSISVFSGGKFIHADSIPVGGNHITLDIARGLSTGIDDAERLKVMHGSALPGADDDRDIVSVAPLGEDADAPSVHAPRAVMNRIVRARVEETLELVRDRLNKSGMGQVVGKRVVLTGGAS
ncbi:MAG: cell division protein FtsA, partial [Rhizobiaceae bacterium]